MDHLSIPAAAVTASLQDLSIFLQRAFFVGDYDKVQHQVKISPRSGKNLAEPRS